MKNILGYRDYTSQSNIRAAITKSVNYENENINSAELLCFFETSKQRTWLVATNKRVYLILDDVRKEYIKVNNSIKISSLYEEDKLIIKIDPKYKPLTGRIYFQEETRGWLYSKKLFPYPNVLLNSIEKILKRIK